MQRNHRQTRNPFRTAASAPPRRPGAVGVDTDAGADSRALGRRPVTEPGHRGHGVAVPAGRATRHALVRAEENARLADYEQGVKSAFDSIVPTLKRISALQHAADFESRAQAIARQTLGFTLPADILAGAWVERLDMRRLYAWCTFATYRRYCDDFFTRDPLALGREGGFDGGFEGFLQSCGFHTLDISPCADGRLAHLIRYVLRLPHRSVRRKSYAGALFDIEDSLQKWVEVEMLRSRTGLPDSAQVPTRYLKALAYHYSSVDPEHEGCAAHGSDAARAAAAGRARLEGFRQAIENSFSRGTSIGLLLIGLDTATDALRVHLPDADGTIDLGRSLDTLALYRDTARSDAARALQEVREAVRRSSPGVAEGMARLVERLIVNNFSQIAHVAGRPGGHYDDIGHAERFIGAGVGFEEIQLRNLMYFAYLDTVEEAAADLDIGVGIFERLNVRHGLPVPVVVRFDYHGQVPGARERAVVRCRRVSESLQTRYRDLFGRGLLHTLQVVRDCHAAARIEILGCSVVADCTLGGQG